MTFSELHAEFDLAFHGTRNFNDSATRAFLEAHDLNLGLSAFNNQLFKQPLIEWFGHNHGLYNVHPALLPDFRGVEPIVPLLLHEQPTAGVTLHSVDSQIDRGAIHYQQSFPVEPDDSVFSLNHKAWHEGARLAKRLIDDLDSGTTLPARDQQDLAIEFGYAPFPSKESVARLHGLGRRLIRRRHLAALHRFPGS